MDCGALTDQRKILKLVDNNLVIVQGRNTLLNAMGTALSTWFQIVDSYGYQSIQLLPGATAAFYLDANFIFVKVDWPINAAIEDKVCELLLPEVAGYIGSMIPFPIGGTGATYSFANIPIKDVFMVNSVSNFPEIRLNNVSDQTCSVNILCAKS